jgi:D-galactarolactone cycloisomerase
LKIQRIDVHVIKSALDVPFAFSQGWVKQRAATLIEITTDTGIIGWGESFPQGLEPPEIAAAAIKNCFSEMLLGQNPLDTERLWFEMYNRSRDFGRKGAVMAAVSGVDIALWDVAGQFYGQPISQLLGGAFRQKVEPYATGFYRIHGQGEASRLADEALTHYENGFRIMKVKLGFGLKDDIKVMDSIQKSLGARDVTLMVDTNHAYGRREALMLGDRMADVDLRWYEEPVVPEDVDGYVELRNRLPMAIAGGENEHGLYGFKSLFSAGALDIAQPDIGSCGGFTGARHIVTLAQAYGVEINPHVWGSAVAQAASLQLIAALPVTHHSIFARQPILEYDQSSHPFRRDLIESPIEIESGMVSIPNEPGLGIAINRKTIEKYKV